MIKTKRKIRISPNKKKKNPPVQKGIKDPKQKVLTAMGWTLTRVEN